jgi:hypothetical protein
MPTESAAVKTTERNGNVVLTIQYDRESIVNMALKVKAEGFVPAETLKAEFGPETFTRCIAILYRDFRMFREVSRPWTDGVDVRGYEWADRRFSRPEIKKIPPDLGFLVELTTPIVAKYGEYQRVIAKCRYINEVRGGCPVKDTDGEPTNAFQRDHEGRIQILRYNPPRDDGLGIADDRERASPRAVYPLRNDRHHAKWQPEQGAKPRQRSRARQRVCAQ